MATNLTVFDIFINTYMINGRNRSDFISICPPIRQGAGSDVTQHDCHQRQTAKRLPRAAMLEVKEGFSLLKVKINPAHNEDMQAQPEKSADIDPKTKAM